jgi:c-di-GMP-binding flagellar brake protein YcgR
MLNEYVETAHRKSRNINLLSAWLFGKVNTGCVLVDISSAGGSALVPKKQNNPASSFDLVIMSPENADEAVTSIPAERSWLIENYSRTHKKIGFKFDNIDQIKSDEIQLINKLISAQKENNLSCHLLNH